MRSFNHISKVRKHPLLQRIEEGEGQHLDFKYEISDAPKIARSLSAFANTDGGSLLVGVKDNGVIAGIASEEEYYMIERAAQHYCQPEVAFHTKEWNLDGKKILEVIIPKGDRIPYKAPDKKGVFKAFVRVADENILACGVQMKVWTRQNSDQTISFSSRPEEHLLLKLLREQDHITLEQLQEAALLSKFKAENLLSDFIVLGLAQIDVTPDGCRFRATDPEIHS
ncbi:MAG: ATP-binding protein [Bacteroidales bacterium]|nr:ATP-binding protein [Bacteroidales bacterium]